MLWFTFWLNQHISFDRNLCRIFVVFFEGPDDILQMKRSQDPIRIPTDSSILTSSEFENPKWRCTCDSHVYWLKSCLSRILESRYDPYVRGCLQLGDTSSKALNEYWCPNAKLVIERLLVYVQPRRLFLYFGFAPWRLKTKNKFSNIVRNLSG